MNEPENIAKSNITNAESCYEMTENLSRYQNKNSRPQTDYNKRKK